MHLESSVPNYKDNWFNLWETTCDHKISDMETDDEWQQKNIS